ncbi:hypothetical protein VTK56DRAFT_343 [Thermocarpiscus australiensis]
MPGVISHKTRTARGKLASSIPPTSNVSTYAKLSKPQSIGKEATENTASLKGRASSIEIVLASRKRKVEDAAESTTKKLRREPETQPVEAATPVSRKRKTVTFAEPENVPTTPSRAAGTPSSSRKRQFRSDETTQAEVLLERLNLQSSPSRKRTKTSVAINASQNDFDLPQALIDLLDLHMAFLKTLSMQCAHSGTNAPIDLRTIYPSVTRTWGKRQVTLEDIQQCVGVLAWTPGKADKSQSKAPFFLSDYGRGKICVEFRPDAEPGPLREHKLNMDFEANLRTLWLSRHDQQTTTLFLATLPKAAIRPCSSSAHGDTTKSQCTLDEFKNSITRKQQEKETKSQKPAAAPAINRDGTKMSLLDRIRLKELQQPEASSSGPTAAELQRRAALQRAEDVAAVVGMLCKATASGQARVAFTMAALAARLRDSSRTPISQEDGAVCVRLLAGEIAPQWLRIVTVGGRENVVVQPAFQPAKAGIQERVRVLLG